MPETRYTDAQLTKLAETPFAGGRGLAGDLAAELLELRQVVADHDDLCSRCGTELLAQHRAATDPSVTESPEDRCSFAFAHTQHWCGNDRCAPSAVEGQVNSR